MPRRALLFIHHKSLMEKQLVRSRTVSCPVPYFPKNAEKLRIENEVREEETAQDRAALAFAEKFKKRSKVPLRFSQDCLASAKSGPAKPALQRPTREVSMPIGRTRAPALDLSGLKKDEEDANNPKPTGALSARDMLHRRQKKALSDKVQGRKLSKTSRV